MVKHMYLSLNGKLFLMTWVCLPLRLEITDMMPSFTWSLQLMAQRNSMQLLQAKPGMNQLIKPKKRMNSLDKHIWVIKSGF